MKVMHERSFGGAGKVGAARSVIRSIPTICADLRNGTRDAARERFEISEKLIAVPKRILRK